MSNSQLKILQIDIYESCANNPSVKCSAHSRTYCSGFGIPIAVLGSFVTIAHFLTLMEREPSRSSTVQIIGVHMAHHVLEVCPDACLSCFFNACYSAAGASRVRRLLPCFFHEDFVLPLHVTLSFALSLPFFSHFS